MQPDSNETLDRLIGEENYEALEAAIHELVQHARLSGDPAEAAAALDLIKASTVEVRARRSHYAAQLAELEEAKRFLGPGRAAEPAVSILG